MLVDPRPYTYEFRKPRHSNPTFQSRNLYESLYHRQSYGNDYFLQQTSLQNSMSKKQASSPQPHNYRQIQRNLSQVKNHHRAQENKFIQNMREGSSNPERKIEDYKLPSISHSNQRAYVGSKIGGQVIARREIGNNRYEGERKEGFQRFRIYERQQKPFNIISCYPKQSEANKLRNFPKLTLQDKLIERGSYHTFKQQI